MTMAGMVGSRAKPGGRCHSPHYPLNYYLIHPESVSMATAESLPIIFICKDPPQLPEAGLLAQLHTGPSSASQV